MKTSSLVTWSMYKILSSLRKHLISKACVLFSSYAVKIHDSHAYRNMDDPRGILLSLQIGFSLVRPAVACAILERISGL